MAKLKNFDEFCNESLILSSEYNYYGPGSLVPMIKQLVREGKDSSIIRSYLTSLGVEAWRIDKAMSEFEVAFGGEKRVNESINEAKATFEETANKFLSELNEEDQPKKATFEDAANAFLLDLPGSDEVTEKLNKETLQVEEGDGEDIDDMIDDLEDGDEDEYQGPDDDAPKEGDEEKIKDSDNASPKEKLEQAAKELAKDSKKLEKIKKILGEADSITVDDNGEEVKDKEGIEDAKTGDEIEVEETFGGDIPKDGAKSHSDHQSKQKKLTEALNEENLKDYLLKDIKPDKEFYTTVEDIAKGWKVDINECYLFSSEASTPAEFGQVTILYDKVASGRGKWEKNDYWNWSDKLLVGQDLTGEQYLFHPKYKSDLTKIVKTWPINESVNDTWKPSPGLFMQPATMIAKHIMEGAESLDQAIARFDNHAEKVKPLLGNADRQNLEMVKPLLEKKLG